MEQTTIIFYLFISGIAIALGHLIFNWYMTPTKDLLKEQNYLLKKMIPPEIVKPEIQDAKDKLNAEIRKANSDRGMAVIFTAIVILIVVIAYQFIK